MEDPAAQQRALAESNKRVMHEAFLMKRATVRANNETHRDTNLLCHHDNMIFY